ncbi:N-acetyltransferase [Aliivibrio salmonicida]|jgi:RimJ/RimL family protein N-acetyltransferase|uniref:Acetyltransferase n=1 Tax=Aliivibrio salmonicida (strain LFI1238) TaxID=316275 RepID=B6EL92_ALISL|nr:GNAT family N-acetyltransferase [Aliivibrio salmonicida]AZL84778.1 N-acetyltransferase [Aliivibrio salmonicida]CAQ79192.1 putative acetyltransferase [Aliivibrio salmonicida LFI1238]
MIVCESERVTVRQFTLDDAEFVIELLNDDSFIRYIADKKVRTIVDAENYLKSGPLASYEKIGFGLSLVMLTESKTPIGMCGLLKRDELEFPDLGYAFLPQYCGKGYALEAAKAVLKEGMKRHSLSRVLAVTLPHNQHSNRLLQQAGFTQTGMVELYDCQNNLYDFTS